MIILPLFFNNYTIEVVDEFSNSQREQIFNTILSKHFGETKSRLGITFISEDVFSSTEGIKNTAIF